MAAWRTLLRIVIVIFAFGNPAFPETITSVDQVIVFPANPNPNDYVHVILYGTEECLSAEDQRDPRVSISGKEIYIDFEQPPENPIIPICAPLIPKTLVTVPIWKSIEQLDIGNYRVTIRHWKRGTLAKAAFSVTPKIDIGGLTTGLTTRRILCKNLTTGKKKVIKGDVGTWDCEAAGLKVNPGDKIEQRVIGIAKESAFY